MGCQIRDRLLMRCFRAEANQAQAATGVMLQTAAKMHRAAVCKSAAARLDVLARRTELETHCAEHGCSLYRF
jgi:hypothetical protein